MRPATPILCVLSQSLTLSCYRPSTLALAASNSWLVR